MTISESDKKSIAESVIFGRGTLTYCQVHACGWLSESRCRDYVTNHWYYETGKRGITIRTRKLWSAACNALSVSGDREIDGSLWAVKWNVREAIKRDLLPRPGKQNYYGHNLENSDVFEILGFVIAPDTDRARMAAAVTLGPRAHHDFIVVERKGVADWDRVKELNDALLKKYKKDLADARLTLAHKLWEIEQIECQASFLEIGATFESLAMSVPE